MHTIAEEGEGEFGVAGEGREGGRAAEVGGERVCVCRSVSIVVGTFFFCFFKGLNEEGCKFSCWSLSTAFTG